MQIIDIWSTFHDIWCQNHQKNHGSIEKIRENSLYVYKNLWEDPQSPNHFLVLQTICARENKKNIAIHETLIHQKPDILR